MAEKKNRQELEREKQLLEMEKETNKKTATEYQALINRGYPEAEAWILASEKVANEMKIQQAQDKYEVKLFEIELKELAKTDNFFADALTFKDEILSKMRKYDCDIQDAYMLVRGPSRNREYQLQQEQRAKAKQTQKPRKLETSSAQPMKSKYQLDDADKKALAGLQKMMPDAGWTAEKYYNSMKLKE